MRVSSQLVLFVLITLFMSMAVETQRSHANQTSTTLESTLVELEADSGGRLGVYALETESGNTIRHRADERFPLTSTFKCMLVSAVLKRSMTDPALLNKRIAYTKTDLVPWSPITEKYAVQGMTIQELCEAAVRYSDNTAANLLMRELGGPEAVTGFARSLGDSVFSLDRWETALNEAKPGDVRDTTSPEAMGTSLKKLLFGDVLGQSQRDSLSTWLKENTTGDDSIRAGVPAGWVVGDKTGGGAYGTTNDIAVLWPPSGSPIILAVYFTQPDAKAAPRKDILAKVARWVIQDMER